LHVKFATLLQFYIVIQLQMPLSGTDSEITEKLHRRVTEIVISVGHYKKIANLQQNYTLIKPTVSTGYS
jgi:hypothetical protein